MADNDIIIDTYGHSYAALIELTIITSTHSDIEASIYEDGLQSTNKQKQRRLVITGMKVVFFLQFQRQKNILV